MPSVDITEDSSIINWIITIGGAILLLLFLAGGLKMIIKNYLAKTITAKAKITDKTTSTYKPVRRVNFQGTVTEYIIVFDADGKTMRFKTSSWVYDSFKKGEKGILRYKGDRFISFK